MVQQQINSSSLVERLLLPRLGNSPTSQGQTLNKRTTPDSGTQTAKCLPATSSCLFFVAPVLLHMAVEMSRIPKLPYLSNLPLRIETHQFHELGMKRLI